jgi:hypothetical protein
MIMRNSIYILSTIARTPVAPSSVYKVTHPPCPNPSIGLNITL